MARTSERLRAAQGRGARWHAAIETRHWLGTAVRRTVWPFVLTAALLTAIGFGMAHYAPGADSIGDVLDHARQK